MNTTLIHWELYERWLLRRGAALLLLLALIWFSLWKTDWVWVILLLLFIWIYARYEWKLHKDEYVLHLNKWWITIGNKLFGRDGFEWFSVGYKDTTTMLHTLYLYETEGDTLIFTFNGEQEEIKDIAELLTLQLPLISPPRMSSVRKLMRFLRI